MQFTQRQRPLQRQLRPYLAAIPLGLLLGLAGPFGTYPAFPTTTRYMFWVALTLAGVVAAVATSAILPAARLRGRAHRHGAVALLSAIPMTFVVAWTLSFLQPGRLFAPKQLLVLFACVAAVQLLIVSAVRLEPPIVDQSGGEADALEIPETGAEVLPAAFPSAFLSRLPPEIGADIIAIETEDHYLRVHTARSSALILMRMADAVAMLGPQLGAQVHRRWWVAEAAVATLTTEGQKLSIRMRNGILVPVGRTFAGAARTRFTGAANGRSPAAAKLEATILSADLAWQDDRQDGA
ncbi:MAG: hypothetical protein RIS17_112 [Pseudomonadota bacterium]|jgi:hypothetical protein